MNDDIILAQALYSKLGKFVSTKGRDNLRSEDDRSLLELYEATGAKSFDRKINGVKVGTSSIKVAPQKDILDIDIKDQDAFEQWLLDTGLGKQTVTYDNDALLKYCNDTGEEPAGASIICTTIPQHPTGTVLKIDADRVFEVMQEKLPQNVVALLGQGD